jgi:hypothetical protein
MGYCQIMVAINREKRPVSSTLSGDRLKFHKVGTIPLIEFRIYLPSGIVITISYRQIMLAVNHEKRPVSSTIRGNRLK